MRHEQTRPLVLVDFFLTASRFVSTSSAAPMILTHIPSLKRTHIQLYFARRLFAAEL